jgi:tRNA (cytidine/uridine-2'-O-)-methyltransferase
MPQIALYQPQIPHNTGALMRLSACFATKLHIIEPCGFPTSDRALKRSGMDYIELATIKRHNDMECFENWATSNNHRTILLTTKADSDYTDFTFQQGDCLLFGQEGAGVPQNLHDTVDHRLTIPMQADARSLNLAISAGIVLAEALRQTKCFPK